MSAQERLTAGQLVEWRGDYSALLIGGKPFERGVAGDVLELIGEVERLRAVVSVRFEVAAFALAMEERLRANDHKGGWKTCEVLWLLDRAWQEYNELRGAVCGLPYESTSKESVLHEAADLANFAMMVADVIGALAVLQKKVQG